MPPLFAELLESSQGEVVDIHLREECPYVPGARMLDWDLPDPAGKPLDFMRQTRDEIENNVKNLIKELT